ncbi:hypothetical protein EYR41_006101 [Orbilia oligospora]|uniref:Uncharacterized protein n=1 Tax=Orbilia oligospora TaxID=2813651 RepID=A0A8H2E440_ORBOL|nr:hypothetical protein EYR41_006101 [Orbilia oligospora]
MPTLQRFAKSGCFQSLSIEVIHLETTIFGNDENRVLLVFTGPTTNDSTPFVLQDLTIPANTNWEIRSLIGVYAALAGAIIAEGMDITINITDLSLIHKINEILTSNRRYIPSHEISDANFCFQKLYILLKILMEHGIQVKAEFRDMNAAETVNVYNKFASIFFDSYFERT